MKPTRKLSPKKTVKKSSHDHIVKKFKRSRYREFVRWVKETFNEIGMGCSSRVYSKDTVDFVIKISRCGDLAKPHGVTRETKKYFLYPLFISDDGTIMIQPKAVMPESGKRSDIAKFLNTVTKYTYDIHRENVGMYKGRRIAFDY